MSNVTVNNSRNFYVLCTVTKYLSIIVLKPEEFLTHRNIFMYYVIIIIIFINCN